MLVCISEISRERGELRKRWRDRVECGTENIFSVSVPPWQFNLTNMCVCVCQTHEGRRQRKRERVCILYHWCQCLTQRLTAARTVWECASTTEEEEEREEVEDHVQFGEMRSGSFKWSLEFCNGVCQLHCSLQKDSTLLRFFSPCDVSDRPVMMTSRPDVFSTAL